MVPLNFIYGNRKNESMFRNRIKFGRYETYEIDDSIFVSTLETISHPVFHLFLSPPTLRLRRPSDRFPKRSRSDISISRHHPAVLLVRNDLCRPLGNRIRFYHCRPFAFYAMSNGLCLCLPPDPWTRSMLGRVTTGDHGRVTYEFFRGNRYGGFTLISRRFGESFAAPRRAAPFVNEIIDRHSIDSVVKRSRRCLNPIRKKNDWKLCLGQA